MLPRRCAAAASLVLVAALSLTGCGGSDSSATDTPATKDNTSTPSTPSPTPTEMTMGKSAGTREMIMIQGDKVTPQSKLVQLKVGEPLTLEIMADKAGELHVHSTPEQQVEFDSGTSEHQITIDKPGVIEVEDHETDSLILKLQVR